MLSSANTKNVMGPANAITGASCVFHRSVPHGNASANPRSETVLRIATHPTQSAATVAHAAPAAPSPIAQTATPSRTMFTNAARHTHASGETVSFLATRIAYAAVVRYAAGMPRARIRVKVRAAGSTSRGVFKASRS